MKEKDMLGINPKGSQYIIAVCETAENGSNDEKGMVFDVVDYFSGIKKYYKNQEIRQESKNKLLSTYESLTDEEQETIILIKLNEGEEKVLYWSEWDGREASITISANNGSVRGLFNGANKICANTKTDGGKEL